MNKRHGLERVLVGKEEISSTVNRIAQEINNDYKDSDALMMICILKGSIMFFTDLVRAIDYDVELDFMQLSSYGAGTSSCGEVRIVKDLKGSIAGKDVIIVEDIIDSGRTAKCLLDLLLTRNPKSIRYCTLLDKPERRVDDVKSHYTGKIIPDEFVVGYGLDYNEQYRTLDEICVLSKDVYENN